MVRPQVVDGGVLQIWRVHTNILKKQSRTADKGWPSSLGVGQGADNPPTIKKETHYKMLQRASELDGCFGMT
jgi:hypothetical protein